MSVFDTPPIEKWIEYNGLKKVTVVTGLAYEE